MIDFVQSVPNWLDVSRETELRLRMLCEIVKKWTPAVNLIAKSTVNDIWDRHVLDSAQLFLYAPQDARRWLDLGSGAGFPGLVIAALSKQLRPDLTITLVESDKRKSVFLAEAARTIDVSVTIVCARAETVSPVAADVVSARALTSLDGLCQLAAAHLKPAGLAIFPKGANSAAEIEAARKNWTFSLTSHPSKTDPAASILLLTNIQSA